MDIATMFNKYSFIGHEFLTWLWYATEKSPWDLNVLKDKKTELTVGNKITITNKKPQAGRSAKVTIQGEESDLKEAMLAVQDGGWVSNVHLRLSIDEVNYEFTLSALDLKFTGFKCKQASKDNTNSDEIDGAICEKMYLISEAMRFIDQAFERFIKFRLNEKWESDILPELSAWVNNSESTVPHKKSMREKLFNL
ncbi:MAG: hypothetical protein GY710_26555 [Desulfobacteraceae bacterium]|nr:hypothetical protein [Desulfobacteraceae bacterium]